MAFANFVRVFAFFSADSVDFKETTTITFSFSFHLCQNFHYEVDEHAYIYRFQTFILIVTLA